MCHIVVPTTPPYLPVNEEIAVSPIQIGKLIKRSSFVSQAWIQRGLSWLLPSLFLHHFLFWRWSQSCCTICVLLLIARYQEISHKCLISSITLDNCPPPLRLPTCDARKCKLCPHGVEFTALPSCEILDPRLTPSLPM